MSNPYIDILNRKLNVLSFAMALAILLCVIGAAMIFIGIEDEGSIDFSATFATGKAKSGFVGVTLIFSSMIIALGALRYRSLENSKKQSQQSIRIKNGDIEIEWKGNLTHWNESHHVKLLLEEILSNIEQSNANNRLKASREDTP